MNEQPWPGEEDIKEVYSPETLRIHAILQDWFDAMAYDKSQYRFPNPVGPVWTEDQLEAMLVELDGYVENPAQMNWSNGTGRGVRPSLAGPLFDAGPGYLRLDYPQRLALAQELYAALEVKDAIADDG